MWKKSKAMTRCMFESDLWSSASRWISRKRIILMWWNTAIYWTQSAITVIIVGVKFTLWRGTLADVKVRASVATLSVWNKHVCQTSLSRQHRFKMLESSMEGFVAMVEVRRCRFDSRVFFPPRNDSLFLWLCSTGSASWGSGSLKGRSCLTLKDFSSDEIKGLLWVSRDLKHRIKLEKQVNKL